MVVPNDHILLVFGAMERKWSLVMINASCWLCVCLPETVTAITSLEGVHTRHIYAVARYGVVAFLVPSGLSNIRAAHNALKCYM
jgi:hypothetical protein